MCRLFAGLHRLSESQAGSNAPATRSRATDAPLSNEKGLAIWSQPNACSANVDGRTAITLAKEIDVDRSAIAN
jgi:hypothetical protein